MKPWEKKKRKEKKLQRSVPSTYYGQVVKIVGRIPNCFLVEPFFNKISHMQ